MEVTTSSFLPCCSSFPPSQQVRSNFVEWIEIVWGIELASHCLAAQMCSAGCAGICINEQRSGCNFNCGTNCPTGYSGSTDGSGCVSPWCHTVCDQQSEPFVCSREEEEFWGELVCSFVMQRAVLAGPERPVPPRFARVLARSEREERGGSTEQDFLF